MKTDGSGERIITEGYHNEGPTFSPNGLFVMFFRDPGGEGGAEDLHGRHFRPRRIRGADPELRLGSVVGTADEVTAFVPGLGEAGCRRGFVPGLAEAGLDATPGRAARKGRPRRGRLHGPDSYPGSPSPVLTRRPAGQRAKAGLAEAGYTGGSVTRPRRGRLQRGFVPGLAEPGLDETPGRAARKGRPRRGRLHGPDCARPRRGRLQRRFVPGLAEPGLDETPGRAARKGRPRRGRLHGPDCTRPRRGRLQGPATRPRLTPSRRSPRARASGGGLQPSASARG